jgi:hypothetical protein
MLKITEIVAKNSRPVLKLEGKLLEPWVTEIKEVCSKYCEPTRQPALDLAGLTFVDHAGKRLLEELIGRGVIIADCSGFVAELLHWEKS